MTPTQLESAEHTFTATELFLFSAVSWHPHRIHFDQDYTRDVEGHPGLLVHGPLQAIHLCRFLTDRIGPSRVLQVESKHLSPLHVGVSATLDGTLVGPGEAPDTTVHEVWMSITGTDRQTTICTITTGRPA